MKEKDFYTLEEIEDEFIGVKGTRNVINTKLT